MSRYSGLLFSLVGSLGLSVACGGSTPVEDQAPANRRASGPNADSNAAAHADDTDNVALARGGKADPQGCVSPDAECGACPQGSRDSSASASGDETRFGARFAVAETSRRGLAKAVANLDDHGDALVQVTGWVGNVCQRKGCWMMLNDDGVQARVLMKGHFSVPTDSQGRAAVVEGTLAKREFTEAQAKHLADDGGQDASKVSGTKTEYVLTATAVELVPSS